MLQIHKTSKFFSFLQQGRWLILIFVILFSGVSNPMLAQTEKERKTTLRKFKKLMNVMTDFKYKDGALEVDYDHDESTVEYKISGVVSMFGVENVEMEAIKEISDLNIKVSCSFPSGASNQMKLRKDDMYKWIPKMFQNKVDLKKMEMTLYIPKVKNNYEVTTWFEQYDNKKIVYKKCSFDSTQLVFTVKKGNKDKNPSRKAALSGNVDIGGVDFELIGEATLKKKESEWAISASKDEIVMNSLITAFQAYNDVHFEGIPDFIRDVTLEEPEVQFDNDKALRISGSTAVGKMEALVAYNKGTKNDFLLGYSPKEGCSLAEINDNLKYLDNIDLENLAVVYAYSKDKKKEISLGLIEDFEFASEKVTPGLVLLGKYEMPNGVPLLEKIDAVTVRADIPSNKSESMALAAKLDFGLLDLGLFKVKEAFLSLEPKDKKVAIGLSVEGDVPEIKGGKDFLALSGETEIDRTKKNLDLVLFMEDGATWDTPFGFPGITISNFGLEVGASGTDKKIGVRGDFVLGELESKIAGKLDSKKPLNSMISVEFDEISMQVLLASFFDDKVDRYLKSLPSQALPASIKNAELTLIPMPIKIADKEYDPGIRIKGKSKVMGLTAELDIMATYDKGLAGAAVLDPIILPNRGPKIFDLGGDALLDFTTKGVTNSDHVFLETSGNVDILGLSRRTEIKFSKAGFSFLNEGKIFDAFDAVFEGKGSNLFKPNDMHVRVAMKNDFFKFIKDNSNNVIDKGTGVKKEAFKKARQAVDVAQRAYDFGHEKVLNAEKAKEAAAAGKKLAQDGFNAAKGVYNGAKDELKGAWDKVPSKIYKTVRIKPCTKKTDWGIPYPSLCNVEVHINVPGKKLPKELSETFFGVKVRIQMPDYGTLLDGINFAKDKVSDAKDKFDREDGLFDKAKDRFNDARDKLKGAVGELDPLKRTLDAAKLALNELESASDYPSMAAKWILDQGLGNVVDVKSAQFEGNLNGLKGGKVSMQCNVLFLGKRFQAELPFEFSNPTAIAKTMANMLLKGSMKSGWSEGFGGDLKNATVLAYPKNGELAPNSIFAEYPAFSCSHRVPNLYNNLLGMVKLGTK